MRNIIYIIILLISNSVFADFDRNVLKGQWSVYQDSYASESYYFLTINHDLSGVFVRSFDGDTITRKFSADSVLLHEGYAEIRLTQNEKAILSAWKSSSGEGRLGGVLYMYKKDGGLFNMSYFPLDLLNQDHKFLKEGTIRGLSEKYKVK